MKQLNSSGAKAVSDQRGQAVAEAIFSVAVLPIIFMGIVWIAQLQNEALSVAQTSRKVAFGQARGKTTTGVQGTPGVLSASYGKSSSNVLPISNNAQARVLAKDWLSLNDETLTVWAQADKRRFYRSPNVARWNFRRWWIAVLAYVAKRPCLPAPATLAAIWLHSSV